MKNNYESKVSEIDKEIGSKDYVIKKLGYEPEDIYDVEFAKGNAFNRGQKNDEKIVDSWEDYSISEDNPDYIILPDNI